MALSGFSLHAARRLHREDRQGLSQLVSYMGRPPLSMERLEEAGDGDLIYNLPHAWKDGTMGIKLGPSEIIEKLVALIPPPRSPLIRYSGVFAPNYSRRDEIILRPGARKQKARQPAEEAKASPSKSVGEGSWARLLKRVFAAEVSHCPRCGRALAIVAAVMDSFSFQRYLRHVGMPAAPPRTKGVQMKVLCEEWA